MSTDKKAFTATIVKPAVKEGGAACPKGEITLTVRDW